MGYGGSSNDPETGCALIALTLMFCIGILVGGLIVWLMIGSPVTR